MTVTLGQYWRSFAALVMLLLLTACPEEDYCVEADDWGYPKLYVSARGHDISGEYYNQVSQPVDSGQVVIDEKHVPVVIKVNPDNRWTAWLGSYDLSVEVLEQFISDDRICGYSVPDESAGASNDWKPQVVKLNEGTCPDPITDILDPDQYPDCNVPCWLKDGMGLYLGLAHDNGGVDDIVVTRHIPDSGQPWVEFDPALVPLSKNYAQSYDVYDASGNVIDTKLGQDRDGYLIKGVLDDGSANSQVPGAKRWDRLYFKILDQYYDDNVGGYMVRIKEGTRSPEPGPLEKVMQTIFSPVNILMERLYNGIVEHTDYINAVRGALVLYIMLYGLSFVMGNSGGKARDIIIRMIKIAVIIALISPGSWEFFYSHLFTLFLDGEKQISALFLSAFGDFDPHHPWYSLDSMLNRLYSEETQAKIFAVLLSNASGLLYFIIIEFAIILFILALVKALLTYVVAYMMTAILIVMAPILMVFMLFDKLKEIFSEWLKHLLAAALEMILLMAAVGMFGTLIVSFLELNLGFKSCWETFFTFNIGAFKILDLQFWFPNVSDVQAYLWMDANQDGVRAIDEKALRYVDIPYFDIVSSADSDAIGRYLSEKNFLSFGDVVIFLGAVFLMWHFIPISENISKALKGGKDTSSVLPGGRELFSMVKRLPGAAWDSAVGTAEVLNAYRPTLGGSKRRKKAGGRTETISRNGINVPSGGGSGGAASVGNGPEGIGFGAPEKHSSGAPLIGFSDMRSSSNTVALTAKNGSGGAKNKGDEIDLNFMETKLGLANMSMGTDVGSDGLSMVDSLLKSRTIIERNRVRASELLASKDSLDDKKKVMVGRNEVSGLLKPYLEKSDISHADRNGVTAMHAAVFLKDKSSIDVLSEGVNQSTKELGTPLMAAVSGGNNSAVTKELIHRGADVNVKDSFGNTALINAVTSGNNSEVGILLAAGADVNIKGAGGQSALSMAAAMGNDKSVKALLANGAHINATDKDGNTALHYAAMMGNNSVAETLTEKGANFTARNKAGYAAAHYAKDENVFNHLVEKETALELKGATAKSVQMELNRTLSKDKEDARLQTASDCYRALGLAPGASFEEVETAHKGLMSLYNPKNYEQGDHRSKAQEKLELVDKAYQTINEATRSTQKKSHVLEATLKQRIKDQALQERQARNSSNDVIQSNKVIATVDALKKDNQRYQEEQRKPILDMVVREESGDSVDRKAILGEERHKSKASQSGLYVPNFDGNHYEVLGISQDASYEEIRKAYKYLARRYHSDKEKDKSEEAQQRAVERFRKIRDAHEVLTDTDKRQHYDAQLASRARAGDEREGGVRQEDIVKQEGFVRRNALGGQEERLEIKEFGEESSIAVEDAPINGMQSFEEITENERDQVKASASETHKETTVNKEDDHNEPSLDDVSEKYRQQMNKIEASTIEEKEKAKQKILSSVRALDKKKQDLERELRGLEKIPSDKLTTLQQVRLIVLRSEIANIVAEQAANDADLSAIEYDDY